MNNNFKFNIGDLVRPKTASQKSRVWKVIKNISKEENEKMVKSLTGVEKQVNIIQVHCESFAYNKTQIKYFDQDDLILVNTSSKTNSNKQ